MSQPQQPDSNPSAKIAEGLTLFPPIPVTAVSHRLWDALYFTYPDDKDLIALVRRNIENTGSPMVNACAVLSLLAASATSSRFLKREPPEMAKLESLFQIHDLLNWNEIRAELRNRWTPEMASLVKLVYAIAEVYGETHRSATALSDRIHELSIYLEHDVLPTTTAVREIIRSDVTASVDPKLAAILETVERLEKPSRLRHPIIAAAIASGITTATGITIMLALVQPKISGIQHDLQFHRDATLKGESAQLAAITVLQAETRSLTQQIANSPIPDTAKLERRDDGYWAELTNGSWRPIQHPIPDKRSKQSPTPPKPGP